MLGVASWNVNRVALRQAFTFEASITVPRDLVVATGGDLVGRTDRDSVVTWTYRSSGPVPFLNITIAPYQVLETAVARIFYFPADSAGARMVAHAIAGAVERYTAWYGPLDREAHLVVMEIPEGFGSQASLTAGIIQTADAFRDRAQLRQLYHELSHLWNVTDLDQPSPRWNEGLAMYLQWRMASELDGWDDWPAYLERTTSALLRRCTQPVPCDSVPFVGYGRSGLTDRSYTVGLLMFYALSQVLGAEAFDRAYREFYQEYQSRGGTTADLVAAFRRMDSRSERVFQDWLFTTRWYSRLASGESLAQMVDGYGRAP